MGCFKSSPGDSDVQPGLRTAGGPLSLQPLPASSSSPLVWPAHTTSALCSWIPLSLVLDIHEELIVDWNFPTQPDEVSTASLPILQAEKLRFRE